MIEREGPTGFITTTTAVTLHAENETRLFSLTLNDSREQTARVMLACAERQGLQPLDQGSELAKWHALQGWLEHGGRAVIIPFAVVLAKAVPPLATRFRRDFRAILQLIEAHALLHRAGRPVDSQGRIVATVADYAAVRDLVGDLMAEGAGATVPGPVRDLVETVNQLWRPDHPVGLAKLAEHLEVCNSTVNRRMHVALKLGYVVNQSESKKTYKLAPGDPLPEDQPVLPMASELERLCAFAPATGEETPTPPPADPQPTQTDPAEAPETPPGEGTGATPASWRPRPDGSELGPHEDQVDLWKFMNLRNEKEWLLLPYDVRISMITVRRDIEDDRLAANKA